MRRPLLSVWQTIKRNPVISGLGIVVVVLLIVDIVFGALNAHERYTWQRMAQDYSANIATELASIFITVIIVGWLFRRQQNEQLKQQLIRDMGGQVNDFALRAVRELRVYGWLTDGTLTGAELMDANLNGANLLDANLTEAHLVSADLNGADLGYTNLTGAHLVIANLSRAILFQANLSGANLLEANLEGASLWSANLSRANLVNANLSRANLIDADLNEAVYTDDTTWPEGFTPPPEAINLDDEATWPEGFTPPKG